MKKTPYESSPLSFAAIQAALNAGNILRKGFGTRFLIASKEDALDLVTEFDRVAEESIISFIKQQFPGHAFLAEESGSSDGEEAEVRWIIDPLDGTLNFAHHIPFFAVSIAAIVDQEIEVGVIYQPITNELFVAQRGRGSYLNGIPLRVSTISRIQQAVCSSGFPSALSTTRSQYIPQFINFLEEGNPLRIIGSAALSLAYVAAGRFDAYWGTNLKPWDVAAGKLLIEEAGGKMTHFDGTPHNIFKDPSTAATNSLLHEAVLSFLA